VRARVECAPQEIERFRTAIHRHLGLRFDDGKLGFLAEVLGRRVEMSERSPGVYLSWLEALRGADHELRALAQELTVTETYFFRNAEQLSALTEVVLPERARVEPTRRPLRILSAGCASGEEVYSLAILCRELPGLAGCPVSIRGLDVNPAMLERASRGRYSPWALRETPAEVQSRYFRADGRELVLEPGVRTSVMFEERNLVDEDPTFWRPGSFDVVFCRNVLMYLAPETAQAVVVRIARSLAPGGFVFLGYAETMRGLSEDFHLRHTHGAFYYQRREAARAGKTEPCPEGVDWSHQLHPFPGGIRAPGPGDGSSPSIPDPSWIELIRQSSERIETLTSPSLPSAEPSPRTAVTMAPLARPYFDLTAAIELMGQERFSEAHASLTQLPPESDRDADVLLLRAVLATHGGDLEAAETLCQKVLAHDEMSAGAHYLMALCREDAGDHPTATDHNRVAAYLDATFAMPRLQLGLLARRAGDYGAARRELGEALALLQREDASRLLLFGGGFGRHGLIALCRAELLSCGGAP
jgi:chemotaxis protein methyltransferase CheR